MRRLRLPLARRLIAAAALAVGFPCAGAQLAHYDLCVRGTSLAQTRTLHLKLAVAGADASSFAPQLGAALANRNFWDHFAQKVYGVPFDPEVCGDAVAEERSLAVTLDQAQASALAAESTRGADGGLLAALDRVLGSEPAPAGGHAAAAPMRPAGVQPARPAAPGASDEVRDADGRLLYHVVRVFYATDRKATASAEPDARFGGERGEGLEYGMVNVTIPRTHERGNMESPSLLRLEFKADPQKHIVLQSITELDADAWRARIGKQATALDNPGILVFIHGYNTSFADAARRCGQLAYDLNFAGAPVIFSWPSRAELVAYTVDEQNAEWSVQDMKAVLAALAGIAPGTPIYVIAHSMGNRVLTRGFKALLEEDLSKRRQFKQVVLAAPDIDADVFKREIAPSILGRAGGPRITLYASSNDKALMASREVHGGYHRLGESGDGLVVMPNLDTVDASNVRTEFLGHSYFGDSDTVVSDLIHLVHDASTRPQDRERFSLDPVRDAVLGLYWRFKRQPDQ